MFQLIQPDYGQIAAGVVVGVGVWALTALVEFVADRLRETKTIKFLKEHYAVIDGILAALPESVASEMSGNPIAQIVTAIVEESQLIASAEELVDAISWAGQKFDWNIHEVYSPDSLSSVEKKLVNAATQLIIDRVGSW
jgi:molecular chaperone GrpE (heat shock protein)